MGKFSGTTVGGGGRPLPGVTDDNYLNLADDWTKSTGLAIDYAKADGKCFMLAPDTAEAFVWRKYFILKRMKVKVGGRRVPRHKVMDQWLRGGVPAAHGEPARYAVPAQWPWEFDQSVSEEMCR